MIRIENISKTYKTNKVLENLYLEIQKGSIYGLVGENGAGKTTLIRILCGCSLPDSGEDICEKIRGKGESIGCLIERPVFPENLSARDCMTYCQKVYGKEDSSLIKEILNAVELNPDEGRKAGLYSLGMKQKLGVAMALSTLPTFLVLDEPFNGLDPLAKIHMREFLLNWRDKTGATILISSHLLDDLERMADRIGVLKNGKILQEITGNCREEILEISLKEEVPSEIAEQLIKNNVRVEKHRVLIPKRENISWNDIMAILVQSGTSIVGIRAIKNSLEEMYQEIQGNSY